jgi:hypothetical protein
MNQSTFLVQALTHNAGPGIRDTLCASSEGLKVENHRAEKSFTILSVCDSAEFKNKLMGVMVYF